MAANPQMGMRLPADVRRWLRFRAADRDTTPGRVVTELVRAEMERAALATFTEAR